MSGTVSVLPSSSPALAPSSTPASDSAPSSTLAPVATAVTTPPARPTQPSLAHLVSATFGKWTLGVPYPLLFVAGAATGILFASLIVLFTHSTRTKSATASNVIEQPAFVAPVQAPMTWQPNVITIRPAAPDPMFDAPMVVEPPSMRPAAPPAARPAAPTAKKAVTRSNVRRHSSGGSKQVATGDLLTAAL